MDNQTGGDVPHRIKSNLASSSKMLTTNPSQILPYKTLSEVNTELDADMLEIVLYHVGDMGLYQKLLFLGMMPFGISFSWVYFVQMFLVLTPPTFWCKVPELASLSMELRRNLSAPGSHRGQWDGCKTFDADWKQVLATMTPPSGKTPKVPCKNGWEFEFKGIPYETIVTERGWVCDRASYVPVAQSVFFAGSFAGGFIFGWIADHYGRVPALVGSNLIGGIGGLATIFTNGVWDFMFCRFLVGMAYDNCFMTVYILVLEYVGPRHRSCMANLPIALYDGLGSLTLPWIAYFVADWRLLLCLTSVPQFFAIPAKWLMPESARWLASRGRVDEAVKVLRKFEKINKRKIPDDAMEDFIESSSEYRSSKKESFRALFSNPPLRVTAMLMMVVYCGVDVVYDASVRLTESLALDFFLAFTITALIEIPSVLLLTVVLDRLGRRNITWAPLFLAAIFLFVAMAVPRGTTEAVLAILARFILNMCHTAIMQWSTEVLPTRFRGLGSSSLHMCGFAFSLVSPFIAFSERHWAPLPLLIMGVITMVASIVSLLLPETKGQEMPQTVADAEKIIMEQSIWRRPEMHDLKVVFSRVMSTTFVEPVHREIRATPSRSRHQFSQSYLCSTSTIATKSIESTRMGTFPDMHRGSFSQVTIHKRERKTSDDSKSSELAETTRASIETEPSRLASNMSSKSTDGVSSEPYESTKSGASEAINATESDELNIDKLRSTTIRFSEPDANETSVNSYVPRDSKNIDPTKPSLVSSRTASPRSSTSPDTNPNEPTDIGADDVANIEPIQTTNAEPSKSNIAASEPINIGPSEPISIEPSEPTNIEPSEPTNIESSQPINIGPSEPIHIGPSEPINIEPSEPNIVSNEPINIGPSEPTNIGSSQPSNIGPSEPLNIGPSEPINIEPSELTNIGLREPINIEPSEPTNIEPSKSTNIRPSEPINIEPSEDTNIGPRELTNMGPSQPVTSNTGEVNQSNAEPTLNQRLFNRLRGLRDNCNVQ